MSSLHTTEVSLSRFLIRVLLVANIVLVHALLLLYQIFIYVNVLAITSLLLQTGTGHFSPVGGYHAAKDMVLILDVARFKYPPHWVPLSLLWEAMDTVDGATGHRRGYALL